MVLELILIGGVVYYYVKKNKQNKLKKAAFQAGEPFYHKDGAVTYPPNYPGLPPYAPAMGDYKRQIPVDGVQQQQQQVYSDRGDVAVVPSYESVGGSEKVGLVCETREVVSEKR